MQYSTLLQAFNIVCGSFIVTPYVQWNTAVQETTSWLWLAMHRPKSLTEMALKKWSASKEISTSMTRQTLRSVRGKNGNVDCYLHQISCYVAFDEYLICPCIPRVTQPCWILDAGIQRLKKNSWPVQMIGESQYMQWISSWLLYSCLSARYKMWNGTGSFKETLILLWCSGRESSLLSHTQQ